jgi:hypothetical protein
MERWRSQVFAVHHHCLKIRFGQPTRKMDALERLVSKVDGVDCDIQQVVSLADFAVRDTAG